MKIYINASDSYEGLPTLNSLDELIDILEHGDYYYYGLRALTRTNISHLGRGYLDKSHDWDFEYDVMSEDLLDGTSSIGVSDTMTIKQIEYALKLVKGYSGKIIALIAGDSAEYGDDEGELFISCNGHGADVVAIVDIP